MSLEQQCGEATKDIWSTNEDIIITSFSSFSQSHHFHYNVKEFGRSIEDLKHMILSVEDLKESLVLVDVVQRLGLDHYFGEQVKTVLERHYLGFDPNNYPTLKETSLLFRLLRRQGHYVSTGIFCDFIDENGRFDEILEKDVEGLMELYEASQLDTGKEEILIEAANFSSKHLSRRLENLEDPYYEAVRRTLEYPSPKSITKFTARRFFKDLQETYIWVEPLKKLAKMEFMIAQERYKEELHQISEWWKGLDLIGNLKNARKQPLKWYTWAMASLEDPHLSEVRIELTKAISFVYVIDDIFDVYGTRDQLILFTQAINRWNMDYVGLPNYMKTCLICLDELTNEISNIVCKNYGYNPVNHLREAWASLCNAFLEEYKWFASNAEPRADEYLEVARVSSGAHTIMVHMFFLLGLGRTGDHKISLDDIKEITCSLATILRLSDDLGSAKDENQNGHDGSYIEYYVKEHQGISSEVAQKHVLEMISNEWKVLNKEQLRLSEYCPVSFTRASLHMARLIPLMYSYDGNQRLPILEDNIKSLLFDDMC